MPDGLSACEPEPCEPKPEIVRAHSGGWISGPCLDEGGELRGSHPGVKKPGKRVRLGEDPIFPEGYFGQLGH